MRTRISISMAGAAVAGALAACSVTIDDPFPKGDQFACGGFLNQHPCIVLSVFAPRSNVLKGDTTRFYADSDSGYAAPVTWSVVGPAEIVEGSERNEIGAIGNGAARSILVRGTAAGSATVTARHDELHAGSGTMVIADSSEITRISIQSFASFSLGYLPAATNTMHVGDSLRMVVSSLSDGLGRVYAGYPQQWATSDTAVARMTVDPSLPATLGVWAHGRAEGAVDVIATFANATERYRIYVVP